MGLVVDPYADTFRKDGKNPISVTVNKDRTNAPFKHISPLFSRMSDSNVHALICCTQIANNTSESIWEILFPVTHETCQNLVIKLDPIPVN